MNIAFETFFLFHLTNLGMNSIILPLYTIGFVCLFGGLRPTRELFAHMETSPYPLSNEGS